MRHALKTLIQDYDRQRGTIMAATTTNGDEPKSANHTVPSKVREWFVASSEATRARSRPTLPPFPPTLPRYLISRDGSKDGKVRDAVKKVERWREISIMMEQKAKERKMEEDKTKITEVFESWL
jgi:hypothetical protein